MIKITVETTLIVSSVGSSSGSKNDLLTMSTAMVANEHQHRFVRSADVYYFIESNSTTVITLFTPGGVYTDLTGESVEIISNYATMKQVAKRMRHLIAVSGTLSNVFSDDEGGLFTIDQLGESLWEVDLDINEELALSDNEINTIYFVGSIRKIQIDIISMFIMQASRMKKNNPGENATSYWSITPAFTREHLRKLTRLKKKIKLKEQGSSYVYSKNTGQRLVV